MLLFELLLVSYYHCIPNVNVFWIKITQLFLSILEMMSFHYWVDAPIHFCLFTNIISQTRIGFSLRRNVSKRIRNRVKSRLDFLYVVWKLPNWHLWSIVLIFLQVLVCGIDIARKGAIEAVYLIFKSYIFEWWLSGQRCLNCFKGISTVDIVSLSTFKPNIFLKFETVRRFYHNFGARSPWR